MDGLEFNDIIEKFVENFKNGIATLDGNFTADQLRLIADRLDEYKNACNPK